MSCLTQEGLGEVWKTMEDFREVVVENGVLEQRRAEQRKQWMWSYVNHRLLDVSIFILNSAWSFVLDKKKPPFPDIHESPHSQRDTEPT